MQNPTSLRQILASFIEDRDVLNTLIHIVILPNCSECGEKNGIRNCIICAKSYCQCCDGDLIKCELCREDLCYDCWSQCTGCCELVCPYCCIKCKLCGGICYQCLSPSNDKGEMECSICHINGYCNDCFSECRECRRIICEECCKNCGFDLYCELCLENHVHAKIQLQ